jgi:NAD(P)-dependent dehydrogenase (short-subunit alcohol dehydrogenase family)
MRIDLTDQVAVVTGSAHRVGKAIALELARRGAHILVHYNSADDHNARSTVQEIKSLGVDAYSVQADISKPDGVEALFGAVREYFKRLDILVNSASVFHKGTLMDVTLETWQRSLDVNLTAPFLCTQAAVRLMRENNPPGGAIVNICDYGSVRPWPDRVDHNVSKAGLLMLTEVSAVNLGPENIRVNAILPGPILKAPDMTDEAWKRAGERSPLGRAGSPEDAARAVAYLVSESYVTGTVVHVNGGEHL